MNGTVHGGSLWAGVRTRPMALALSLLLQVAPLFRSSAPLLASTLPLAAVILRWVSIGSLALGAYHGVSAASASVSGLTQYQNNRPTGKALTNVVTRVGLAFNYRITVLNPGDDHASDYFNVLPNPPPGLNINTNIGGSGFITGTPSEAGLFKVRLLAGNTLYPEAVTLDAWIQVEPALLPPSITTQPQSVSILSGQNAVFTVVASGTAPLSYQWFTAAGAIAGATNATLTLTSVAPSAQGNYWAVISNTEGSLTSAKAFLTVQEPFIFAPVLEKGRVVEGVFAMRITGPAGIPHVLLASPDAAQWSPVRTNTAVDGIWQYTEPAVEGTRFFRVRVGP